MYYDYFSTIHQLTDNFTGFGSHIRRVQIDPCWKCLFNFLYCPRYVQRILHFTDIKDGTCRLVLDVECERMIGVECTLFYLVSDLHLCVKNKKNKSVTIVKEITFQSATLQITNCTKITKTGKLLSGYKI